jgi:two-component system chemotaxis family response regulator WspR
MMKSGEDTQQRLADLQREVETLREHLEQYSMVDPATEIASANYFADFLDRQWRTHARRGDAPISVLLIEPDEFDGSSDAEPDDAKPSDAKQAARWLRQIARMIKACATRAGDIAARCGEHTFGMVLSETDEDGAALIAQKIQDTVDALSIPWGEGHLTVTVGLATTTPSEVTGLRSFIESAEGALEAARQERPRGLVRA